MKIKALMKEISVSLREKTNWAVGNCVLIWGGGGMFLRLDQKQKFFFSLLSENYVCFYVKRCVSWFIYMCTCNDVPHND